MMILKVPASSCSIGACPSAVDAENERLALAPGNDASAFEPLRSEVEV